MSDSSKIFCWQNLNQISIDFALVVKHLSNTVVCIMDVILVIPRNICICNKRQWFWFCAFCIQNTLMNDMFILFLGRLSEKTSSYWTMAQQTTPPLLPGSFLWFLEGTMQGTQQPVLLFQYTPSMYLKYNSNKVLLSVSWK